MPRVGVEAVDRLDERKAGHLLEVLERLRGAPVAAGEAAGEREVSRDERVTRTQVAGASVA